MVPIKARYPGEYSELLPGAVAQLPDLAGAIAVALAEPAIDWAALKRRIASSPPAISDEARVQLLRKLLNNRKLQNVELSQLYGLSVSNSDALPIELPNELTGRLREKLRQCLDSRQELERLEAILSAVVLIHREGDNERIIAKSIPLALIYAVTRAARAGNVRVCPHCGKVFPQPAVSGRPRKFCTKKCSDHAHTADAPRRMSYRKRR